MQCIVYRLACVESRPTLQLHDAMCPWHCHGRLRRHGVGAYLKSLWVAHTGASEKKTLLFTRAFALQTGSRNSSPAPELALFKLIVAVVLLSAGVFSFSRHFQ